MIIPTTNESLLAAFDRYYKLAESISLCNFAFSVVLSNWKDSVKKEMEILVGTKGINSFILDFSDDDLLFEVYFLF